MDMDIHLLDKLEDRLFNHQMLTLTHQQMLFIKHQLLQALMSLKDHQLTLTITNKLFNKLFNQLSLVLELKHLTNQDMQLLLHHLSILIIHKKQELYLMLLLNQLEINGLNKIFKDPNILNFIMPQLNIIEI